MKIFRFLFYYAPTVIILTAIISIIGGLSSVLLLMIFNAHLKGIATGTEDQRWPRKIGQGDKLIPTDRRTGFYGQGYQAAVFG